MNAWIKSREALGAVYIVNHLNNVAVLNLKYLHQHLSERYASNAKIALIFLLYEYTFI